MQQPLVIVNLSRWPEGIEGPPAGWPRAVALLRQAVETIHMPQSWRLSEYAMTKATAQLAVAAVEEQLAAGARGVELDLFDWSVLEGELARLWLANGRDPEVLSLSLALRQALLQDPEAAQVFTDQEAYRQLYRRIARTQAQLEDLERHLREHQRRILERTGNADFAEEGPPCNS